MSVDQSSVAIAARRRIQLTAALVVDVVAFVLAVAALAGGRLSALAPLLGTLVTGVALTTSFQRWAGARQVWSGGADPARLRGLVQRNSWPSAPVLIDSCGVSPGVGVPLLVRVFSGWPAAGNATWSDGVLLASLVLYLFASAAAALYPLRVRR